MTTGMPNTATMRRQRVGASIAPLGPPSPAIVLPGSADRPAGTTFARGKVAGAICNMLGADEVSIHLVDLRSETMKPIPDWERSKPLSAAFRDFLMHAASPIREDRPDGSRRGGSWPGESLSGGSWYDHGQGEKTLSIVLERRNGRAAVILCDFSHRSAAQRLAAARLAPDLMTLIDHHVDVNERLHRLEVESAAAIAALDHGEYGIIALTAKGMPVFVNAAARDFLDEGRGLHVRRGEVRLSGFAESVRFRAALEDVADTAKQAPNGSRSRAMTMLLPQADGRRPVLLVIAPATGRAVPGGGAATALLYIVDSQHAPEAPIAAVCRLHGLSRTETGLIAYLIEGLTLSEAAGKMRIKVDTARTYLKQVFAKTDTHRQVDLVALISRYSRAVRGDFDFQPA